MWPIYREAVDHIRAQVHAAIERDSWDLEVEFHENGLDGLMEIYASSYFHFAPGLSDMAALNLDETPSNAYYGMFFDSDGPQGSSMPRVP